MTTTNHREPPVDDDAFDEEDRDVVVDPDFILIGRLLGGDLTEDERSDMDRRIETDPEFRSKAGPLMGLFALHMPLDVEAFVEAFGPPAHEPKRLLAREPVAAPPTPTALPAAPPPTPLLDRIPPTPLVQPQTTDRLAPVVNGIGAVLHAVWVFIKWCAATLIGLYFIGLLLRNWKPATYVEGQLLVHGSKADSASIAQSIKEYAIDHDLGRALVTGYGQLVQDSAGPEEKRIVVFNDHSRAVVLPNSRVAFRIPKTVVERVASLTEHDVTIDGEVVFQTLEPWIFQTRFARIEVGPGMFAIRCVPRSTVLQVSVGRGQAWVYVTGEKDSVLVRAGDYLTVPQTGAARITHDSTGFPLFGDTATMAILRKTP